MSPYLAHSDYAFTPIIEDQNSFDQDHLPFLQQMLRIHPKATAQMVATSKVKGCNAMLGFHYEQQIPLPWEVSRDFATDKD
eukprot:386074-Ditylum_brightwellii.AAC.1